MSKTSVYTIVLNWNGYKDTLECLSSLEKVNTKGFTHNIIVVDNASTNDSVTKIQSYIKGKSNIKLLQNINNMGFAGGNNMGIKYALHKGADFVLVINNDTFVDKIFMQKLLNEANVNKRAASLTPKIYFAKGYEFHKKRYKSNELGKIIWSAGGLIDWDNVYGLNRGVDEVDKGQYDKVEEVDFATGACVLLRSEALKEVGVYNEDYFMYLEDVELSHRLRLKKWQTIYVPKSIIWHKVSRSSSIGNVISDYFITRNRMAFGVKYAPLKSKLALIRESIWLATNGRTWQTIGAKDFYLRKFGKGSWDK